ncbi:unnamed protein product [Amaranthus hypochondriacus]
MEAFYQESGRAGRDQLPCRSVLYYSIDDRKRMEFILKNPQSKKSESSRLADLSSKKPLDDFRQMIEYCEGSDCRRKKILQSFGEQAPASLCGKTCDACKQPNVVAKHLEQLSSSATLQKNLVARVFVNSSMNLMGGEQSSEFWNRSDDESYGSEEEISDSDDDIEVSKSLSCSRLPSRLNEKLDILQRAEEKYYQSRGSQDQTSRKDKNSISYTLRESCKQKLLNALKETQQRLGRFDIESAVTILESECYKKCVKSGKSFYISQMAGTVRWLSTVSLTDLTHRLQPDSPNMINLKQEDSIQKPTSSSTDSNKAIKEIVHEKTIVDPLPSSAQTSHSVARKIILPPIPSFSDFVRSTKPKSGQGIHRSDSKRNSAGVSGTADKRKRLQ